MLLLKKWIICFNVIFLAAIRMYFETFFLFICSLRPLKHVFICSAEMSKIALIIRFYTRRKGKKFLNKLEYFLFIKIFFSSFFGSEKNDWIYGVKSMFWQFKKWYSIMHLSLKHKLHLKFRIQIYEYIYRISWCSPVYCLVTTKSPPPTTPLKK